MLLETGGASLLVSGGVLHGNERMSGRIFIDGGPTKGLPSASSVSSTDLIMLAQDGTPGVPGTATVRAMPFSLFLSYVDVEWNAGTVTALGAGVLLNGGTISIDAQSTIAATATGTITPAGASCLVNMGTVDTTLSIAGGTYNGQHLRLEILQGTTAHGVAFDGTVIFGTDVPSFTPTAVGGKRDLVQLIWNGAKWMFVAANHGF